VKGNQDYAYFEHDADIGVVGRGATIEAAFVAAAHAVFSTQTDPDAVRPVERIEFAFSEADPELALVTWLNRLLGEARARGLALAHFGIRRDKDLWSGWAAGERWRAEHSRGTEVKGATLTMLSVRSVAGGWEARCVVDV
jgi:SHS2 domain-containing protein